ncbi:hypothetical protein A7B51_00045 [Lentilactobacillus parabuchneri]|uniref:hypothetical protein n=1 Tax=Lentilactobacillus parabuchneri TaxID=152331 RepID=UPI0007F957DA|nr:hypothetical protein [Lentilactobacillus parabuchneri]OBU97800.1 hypothetical protein A7B51_00045 [Lentilactobacillus parabuchneri]
MAYDLAKVTANGNNLIAQILANKSSLSIDKIEISDTQLPSTTDISTMTSVPKVVQTVSANGFSKNSNTLIISTVVDNSSISADYKAWVFGIWGSDSQNGQSQLIAVITSTNSPDTIPAFSGSTPVSYTYKFNIGFSNASQIQFNMIDDSFATNDTVVHTTGDETIDGQKKFKTDPTDGAGNAYAKTIDVNQQLDKKVNVADMRKPASDVAGIEEVNAKQDKIGYTPADDSKVVHDNHDNTITANSSIYDLSKSGLTSLQLVSSGSFNDLPLGTVFVAGSTKDGPDSTKWFTTTTFYFSDWGGRKAQIAIADNSNLMFFRTYEGNPAIWNSWTKLADDSKVAHLSGANNFDTVPTVNDNPLLLASSLPSDLARTGSDQEFTGKNTFDTAPIDKTTGNPYITKDGVPSLPPDLARTGQAQTFTAAQTFSIAPTIKDASKDKGDNQAATMADLKSLEDAAWHQLNKGEKLGGTLLYKIDQSSKRIYVSYSLDCNKYINSGDTIADFSSIVKNIKTISGRIYFSYILATAGDSIEGVVDNFSIGSPASIVAEGRSQLIYIRDYIEHVGFSDGAYFTYDSLVN